MFTDQQVIFAIYGSVSVLLLVIMGFSIERSMVWKRQARRLEVEANDASDRLVQVNKDVHYQSDLLVALNERVDAQDELIASLTAQRDSLNEERVQIAKDTREAQNALRRWAIDNPGRAIRDLNDLANKAYVHGPGGRLTRFVPKEPTVG